MTNFHFLFWVLKDHCTTEPLLELKHNCKYYESDVSIWSVLPVFLDPIPFSLFFMLPKTPANKCLIVSSNRSYNYYKSSFFCRFSIDGPNQHLERGGKCYYAIERCGIVSSTTTWFSILLLIAYQWKDEFSGARWVLTWKTSRLVNQLYQLTSNKQPEHWISTDQIVSLWTLSVVIHSSLEFTWMAT